MSARWLQSFESFCWNVTRPDGDLAVEHGFDFGLETRPPGAFATRMSAMASSLMAFKQRAVSGSAIARLHCGRFTLCRAEHHDGAPCAILALRVFRRGLLNVGAPPRLKEMLAWAHNA